MRYHLSNEDLLAAQVAHVPDVIAHGLTVLFCGINPGLYTAATGYHFARPGNRFWRALYASGLTPELLAPDEQSKLLALGYGITNLVTRASATAAELSAEELTDGGKALHDKVLQYQPQWLAVLGIDAYKKAFNVPKASVGRQPRMIGQTQVWLLPNPSGLNAHYTPLAFAHAFAELGNNLRT